MKNHAVILSGGVGSRFWPLSRERKPKQFLNICTARSMLEDTVARIRPVVKKENIHIAANKMHRKELKRCLRGTGIPAKNLFFEPAGKSTLAPVAALAEKINCREPGAVMVVMPSDHFIRDAKKFTAVIKKGIAAARKGYIVTLGITPTRPETGYGYIKCGPPIKDGQSRNIFRIDKFIEKPSLGLAKSFFRNKNYYWNSGAFIFRADVILDEVEKFIPEFFKIIKKLRPGKGFERLWHKLSAVSIDYGIMEKTKLAVVLPADYGWTDVGSWQALAEIKNPDRRGNILVGNCLDLGSKSTFVWSDKRLVATVGLNGLVVVDTGDALLVCAKERSQDVKKLVGMLKMKNLRRLS